MVIRSCSKAMALSTTFESYLLNANSYLLFDSLIVFDLCFLPFQLVPAFVGIGVVIGTAIVAKIYFSYSQGKPSPKTLLDPNAKYSLVLVNKHVVSHDTRRFTFALPSEEHVLGENFFY